MPPKYFRGEERNYEIEYRIEISSIQAENEGSAPTNLIPMPEDPDASYYDTMGRHGGPRGQGNPPEVSGGRRR